MKQPACVALKWGSGTTCEKTPDTQSKKDFQASLESLRKARESQDAIFFSRDTSAEPKYPVKASSSSGTESHVPS